MRGFLIAGASALLGLGLSACGGSGGGDSVGSSSTTSVNSSAGQTQTPSGNGSGSSNGSGGNPAAPTATIKLLSNRADLVSGDDALVEIVLPAGVDVSQLAVDLNGVDVTAQFAQRSDGRTLGLLSGLSLGSNLITASLPRGARTSYALTNHPNGGPIFSGPQVQPWKCGNAAATDPQCNQPAEYSYLYKSTDPTKSGLQPYDPASPSTDVAMTTTDQGLTLPFIVRVETGYRRATSTRSSRCSGPARPGPPGRRSRSGTASCSSLTAAVAA